MNTEPLFLNLARQPVLLILYTLINWTYDCPINIDNTIGTRLNSWSNVKAVSKSPEGIDVMLLVAFNFSIPYTLMNLFPIESFRSRQVKRF